MKNVIIKVTTEDGRFRYVKEYHPYSHEAIVLTSDYNQATKYMNILEFKVAWGLLSLSDEPFTYCRALDINKEDVVKFEAIDASENKVEFDLWPGKRPDSTLYFEPNKFEMLKRCGIASSCWLYDEDGNWIAFPKATDFDRVSSIRYYKRGLTICIDWVFPFRNHSIPSCYSFFKSRKPLLFDSTIQRLFLHKDIGGCEAFTVLPTTAINHQRAEVEFCDKN